mmetsp:Transcript_56464/g.127393  ORF Transcript_56464/g.127393 Transcript_56464/m.127393 type:complete len:395 (+) Transcript_56464:44-1228(+)
MMAPFIPIGTSRLEDEDRVKVRSNEHARGVRGADVGEHPLGLVGGYLLLLVDEVVPVCITDREKGAALTAHVDGAVRPDSRGAPRRGAAHRPDPERVPLQQSVSIAGCHDEVVGLRGEGPQRVAGLCVECHHVESYRVPVQPVPLVSELVKGGVDQAKGHLLDNAGQLLKPVVPVQQVARRGGATAGLLADWHHQGEALVLPQTPDDGSSVGRLRHPLLPHQATVTDLQGHHPSRTLRGPRGRGQASRRRIDGHRVYKTVAGQKLATIGPRPLLSAVLPHQGAGVERHPVDHACLVHEQDAVVVGELGKPVPQDAVGLVGPQFLAICGVQTPHHAAGSLATHREAWRNGPPVALGDHDPVVRGYVAVLSPVPAGRLHCPLLQASLHVHRGDPSF